MEKKYQPYQDNLKSGNDFQIKNERLKAMQYPNQKNILVQEFSSEKKLPGGNMPSSQEKHQNKQTS